MKNSFRVLRSLLKTLVRSSRGAAKARAGRAAGFGPFWRQREMVLAPARSATGRPAPKQFPAGRRINRLLGCLLLCLASLAGRPAWADVDPAVLKAEADRVAVVAKASAATVAVFASNGQGGGSGVVISPDGYALSNFHVTREAGNAMKCGMADGQLYDAVIVGLDPTGDVALLKLLGREDFPHAPIADSDRVQVGDWCFAIGNPFLLATDFHPTVSYGVISGVHRYQYPAGTLLEYADCLQADAAINPGNSGGPLFDAQGLLIGINGRGSFEKRGRVNVGVGYAISINQIKNFLGHLKSGRIVDHATLGARVSSDEHRRVLVDDILDESDAFRRGLRFGDEILSFAGRPIGTVNGFKNALGIYPRGWRVPLVYRRKNETHETKVRLRGVHREAELVSMVLNPPKAMPPQGREPKPGKRPEKTPGKKPDDPEQPEKTPKGPRVVKGHQPKPMPEIAKRHFTAKPGYVNFFFNDFEQKRVWKSLVSEGDFSTLTGKWTLEGELAPPGAAGTEITLELSAEQAALTTLGGEAKISLAGPLNEALGPPNSGGLLVALALWRKLLVEGPSKFSETYYVGTFPLAGHEGLVDGLSMTQRGVECRFYVDPHGGRLLGMEMFPDDDTDPCEIYFGDYRELEGRAAPYRLDVRYGDGAYGVFQLKQYKFDQPL